MWDKSRALDPDLAPHDLTAETFIATDQELATFIHCLPCDEEMLHLFTMKNTSNNDVEMIDDECDEKKSTEKKSPNKDKYINTFDWKFNRFIWILQFSVYRICQTILSVPLEFEKSWLICIKKIWKKIID